MSTWGATQSKTSFQRFLDYRATFCAEGTVLGNRRALAMFEAWLQNEDIGPEEVTREDAEAYLVARSQRRGAAHPASITGDIYILRSFYRWLCENGAIERNPVAGIQTPREKHRIPETLTEREIKKIDRALTAPNVRDIRDRSLIAFILASGCRSGEARGLDLNKLDLERREAIVLGKGNKERVVFYDPGTAEKIRLWLRTGRSKWAGDTSGPVWVGRHGKRLNPTTVRDALQRAARDSGIGRNVWPHLLRHTQATRLLEHGMNIRELQEFLGHSDLGSTQIYTHVRPERLHSRYDEIMAHKGSPNDTGND